jgi:cell division transport system permease protein
LVFVKPDATEAATAAIGTSLNDLPGVVSVSFVDQQAAYEEFQRLYADRPELLESVTPEVLPPSFRVTLADTAGARDVMAVAETLDGVGQVVLPAAPDPGTAC